MHGPKIIPRILPPGDYILIDEEIVGHMVRCRVACGPYRDQIVFRPRVSVQRVERVTLYDGTVIGNHVGRRR